MKKLIALSISASMLMTSAVAFADTSAKSLGVDAVSKATGDTTTTYPTTPAKTTTTPAKTTTTPAKTTTTPAKTTTTPAKPATPATPATPAKPAVVTPVYKDGIYTAWGNAYTKGTEGAQVTIKDGKIVAINLIRSSQKMIDNNPSSNYQSVWTAYKPMMERFLGKTRAEAAKVDTVAGATRTTEGWKIAVDRAFQRALTAKPADQKYFEGEHMGVDPEGKYMVFAKFDKTKLVGVKAYAFSATGSLIENSAQLTQTQAAALAAGLSELGYNGTAAKPVAGFEKETTALYAAYADAEKNATIAYQSKYVDGFYSAYSPIGRTVGIERADVQIRNDKLVDVKLYRLGADLKDRGTAAYANVVSGNAPAVAKFLSMGGASPYFNAATDVVTGATQSVGGWNQAILNAFAKAQVGGVKSAYFNGTFNGVDNQSRVLVIGTVKADKVTDVKTYLLKDGRALSDTAMTADQKEIVARFNEGLMTNGKAPALYGQGTLVAAANAAYADFLANASTKQGNFKDGTYTTYGHTYDKGTNQAVVTLRNGVVVDLKIARTGYNFVDRGAAAYAEVVKFIPTFLKDFLNAATRSEIAKVEVATVDAATGATATGQGLKDAIEYAYQKAEIKETAKTAFINDVFPGKDAKNSMFVMTTIEKDIPVRVQVYYIDAAGKVIADTALTPDQLAVRAELQQPVDGKMYKYAYRPAAPATATDSQKALYTTAFEAIANSLANAAK